MLKHVLIGTCSVIICFNIHAQHEGHEMQKPAPASSKTDTVPHSMHHDSMGGHQSAENPGMMDMRMPSHSYSRNLPMERNSSGTAWNPDESPMFMWMMQGRKTDWMFHANVFPRYTATNVNNSDKRGKNKLDAPNWFMAMANHRVGERGLLSATAMISLDPLIESGSGYPLLFQTGETYKGKRLVDQQHPHDLFSGLTVGYTQSFGKDMDAFIYIGYPGEPALGAPAFMHRISAMNIPDAPLGHHWQDATHITYGVTTAGFRYRNWKVDGSVFTGREPDEERYGFDPLRFDSYSWRLSYNPAPQWAMQFSQAYIHSPEALEPEHDVTRTSASVLYAHRINRQQELTAALIWGLNSANDGHREHAVLAEANYRFDKNAVFTRYEFVQKTAEELDLVVADGAGTLPIHAVSLGYNRVLASLGSVDIAIWGMASVYLAGEWSKADYGDTPVSLQAGIQLRPPFHRHH